MRTIEAIRDKIKKLWAMSVENGCTEAEMLAFHTRAQAMMDAHQITDADIQEAKDEAVKRYDEMPGTDDPHLIKWHLSYAVGKHCGVQIFRKANKGRALAVIGSQSDIDWALWFLDSQADFVFGQLVEHLILASPPPSEKRTVRRVFVEACCGRISDRLAELERKSEAARTSTGRELIVIKGQAVEAYCEANGLKFRSCCGGGQRNGNEAAHAAGRAAGDRASLGRPLTGNGAALRIGRHG